LTRTGCFAIEVRTNEDPAHCYDNGRYFDDFSEAAIEAIFLQERWSQIREARSEKLVSRLRDTNSAPAPFQMQGLFRRRGISRLPGEN
jgi:hypothetical protein